MLLAYRSEGEGGDIDLLTSLQSQEDPNGDNLPTFTDLLTAQKESSVLFQKLHYSI